MLSPQTPFPNVGSYALYQDPALPEAERGTELVRIFARDWNTPTAPAGAAGLGCGDAAAAEAHTNTGITFPLRTGASGAKRVALADLIDGTPLNETQRRELADLDRELRGRDGDTVGEDGRRKRLTPRQKALGAHRDRLKQRAMWAPFMAGLVRRAEAMAAAKRKAA